MPYIKKDRRPRLNHIVGLMGELIENQGEVNYILFAYAKRHVEPGYVYYKDLLGELTEAAAEIRRRLLAPYEDQKILENGDIE